MLLYKLISVCLPRNRVDVFQLSTISVLSDVDCTENVLTRENCLCIELVVPT